MTYEIGSTEYNPLAGDTEYNPLTQRTSVVNTKVNVFDPSFQNLLDDALFQVDLDVMLNEVDEYVKPLIKPGTEIINTFEKKINNILLLFIPYDSLKANGSRGSNRYEEYKDKQSEFNGRVDVQKFADTNPTEWNQMHKLGVQISRLSIDNGYVENGELTPKGEIINNLYEQFMEYARVFYRTTVEHEWDSKTCKKFFQSVIDL